MEINSIDDVNALNEYQKVKQIERIEKKIHRLSFVPASTCAGLIMWFFLSTWLNASWTPMNLLLIAIAIGSVGHSNVQRTDLLKQLFKLKYGE
ncbi:hypothetical protein [Alkalimonas sp.]|uniref:hypothetical protein n=1 Tax=Alkalimonas sp. TaxID=1872453 RepID=UPI00263B7AA9|nr:hypothetical protein [Alkalimonas sp.]MCC5825302.1 hypothetical protein [Alkalimonas sp.]